MLLPAVEHQPHRRARFARQVRRDHTFIARAKLRAKAAAHELRDHPHLALRQLEDFGKLIAHARCALRGGIHRQLVRLPVDDKPMRLQRRVRLHLREVLALHNHVRVFEARSISPFVFCSGPCTLPVCGTSFGPPPPPALPAASAGPGNTSGASGLRASPRSTTKGFASYLHLRSASPHLPRSPAMSQRLPRSAGRHSESTGYREGASCLGSRSSASPP